MSLEGIADAVAVVDQAWTEGWAPPRSLTVAEWADSNIRLTAGPEKGPYRVDRTPYAVDPMNAMGVLSPTQEVVLIWASQTSKSTIMNICMGYWVDVEPDNAMLVQPTLDLAKRYSKTRVVPLIKGTPSLLASFSENKSRDESNTMLLKEFKGGQLVIAGANSAATFRSVDIRYMMEDEIDGYPSDVDGEGDPCALAANRQTTYGARRKTLLTSTPTNELTSRVEPAYKAGTQEHYHVPCPHCGHFQWLKWANLKWPAGEPDKAAYACAECGSLIEERYKADMLPRGLWVADNPGAQNGRVRSFHLSGLYSPLGWLAWSTLAREWIAANDASARGDLALLTTFVNTRLAETWKEAGEQTDAKALQKRAEPYPLGVVPMGALMLTAAADVQGNRIEVEIDGWGPGDENWTVDKRVFWDDPSDLLSGKNPALDEYLKTPLFNDVGVKFPILATAIDSGGHHTHDVYMFCRIRRKRLINGVRCDVFAVKGSSIAGKPIVGKPSQVDIDYRGTKLKHGAQLWPVGSDTAKELIFNRLRVTTPGPGYLHFSADLDDEHYQQLTSEKLVTRYHKGRPRREFVLLKGRRNEALDLKVYNFAAAVYAGITRMKAPQWEAKALEVGYVPPVVSIQPAQQSKPQPAPRVVSGDSWLGDRTKNWMQR